MLPCPPCWLRFIFSAGSLCSITSVRLSGAGKGPKSLLATFSFQVPLKFGLLCATVEAANAVTDRTATIALRIIHFPFKRHGDEDRRCSLAYHFGWELSTARRDLNTTGDAYALAHFRSVLASDAVVGTRDRRASPARQKRPRSESRRSDPFGSRIG